MIRCIVAIDDKRGMANEHGIPWQGKLPTDVAYFREKTIGSKVVMGYRTYEEFNAPLEGRENIVVSRPGTELRPGFVLLEDVASYLKTTQDDVWVIGGGGLFAQTIELADELYITRIEGDYHCTVLFPEFDKNFTVKSRSEMQTENDINFCFEVWERKSTQEEE